MKKINKIYTFFAVAMGLASCSNEAPFSADYPEGTGRVLTSSLDVQVKAETPMVRANENGIPTPADFKVEFFNKENEKTAAKNYDSYGKMPEIVVLPAGEYKIKVSFGGTYGDYNESAAFSAPHYEGSSEYFTVEKDKIVDNLDPIIGRLANVRVGVNFDTSLASAMGPDSKVSVKVGEKGSSLDFNLETKEDGYFAFAEGSETLVATFTGTVEGIEVSETKTFQNVKKGNYYRITFRLHAADASGNGNIDPDHDDSDFVIDASVTYKEVSDNDINNVTPDNDQDIYLEDDMRPENGEDPNIGNDPGTEDPGNQDPAPENPDDPKPDDQGSFEMTVTPGIELGAEGNNLVEKIGEDDYLINGLKSCDISVKTSSGIKEFKIYISSTNSTFEGIINEMFNGCVDLVTETSEGSWDTLSALGIEVDLKDKKDVVFELAKFCPFLEPFPGKHIFNICVEDKAGNEDSKTLRIEIPKEEIE